MAVKCLNCDYEMSTEEEVKSALVHVFSGIFGVLAGPTTQGILGPVMNQQIGNSKGVKCPNCGEIGRWEDK